MTNCRGRGTGVIHGVPGLLEYNKTAPLRFTHFMHFTANAGAGRVHKVDLDAAHDVHMPPLQQAICDRADINLGSPLAGVAADPTTFLELHLEEMPAPGNRMMYLRRLSRDGE
ncbi:hypothetical protein QYE76_037459 [Lolium multiflorum]|uniref:Uncharacterized protein n=1 Tax=Lolium multiflorum TaxID=4521 RepID=A0AAD8QE90_LOLMU|nr:hypothetical protein QYE76_037459 [Lolium multiflorum]